MKIIIMVLLVLAFAGFIAPVMARLFDKATYGLGNWLLKHFPSSGIVQRPYEQPKQRYSRVYIPKPIKDLVNYIFRQLQCGNRAMKKTKSTCSSEKTNNNPLGKQPLNTGDNPRLEFKANCISKGLHSADSIIGEKDVPTKSKENPVRPFSQNGII